MKLLEFEAKQLLDDAGIAIPKSYIAADAPEFLPAVIKSQIPIGGRGKAGGIAVVETEQQYNEASRRIRTLAIKGFTPKTLLAEEKLAIKHEYYLSVLIDKATAAIHLMAHREGGVEVESQEGFGSWELGVGSWSADAIGQELADYFDLPDKTFALQDLVEKLYKCFVKNDALLIEINPLALTESGDLVAGDCKMELDDAARFRHKDWAFEAGESNANFVTLNPDGNVATIANGAGLAMATVDAVASAGLAPANFLDVGGGANEASVLAAFQKIMEYPSVKVIVINIFAGITRCDEVARAIIAARSHITHLPPLSIRLSGTNFDQAVQLLAAEEIPTLATLEECLQHAKEHAL